MKEDTTQEAPLVKVLLTRSKIGNGPALDLAVLTWNGITANSLLSLATALIFPPSQLYPNADIISRILKKRIYDVLIVLKWSTLWHGWRKQVWNKAIGLLNYCLEDAICGTFSSHRHLFASHGDFHCKDKTVVRPSYLYHGIPYAGKMASLYIESWCGASEKVKPTLAWVGCKPSQWHHTSIMVSQINGYSTVCSTLFQARDQRKHQISCITGPLWWGHAGGFP